MTKALWINVVVLMNLSGCAAETGPVQFTPPSSSERLRAIGSTKDLDPTLQRALDPGGAFQPISPPGPSDWLANHLEKGQTFDAFTKSGPHLPHGARKVIYFLPLGRFAAERSPDLDTLKSCAEAYFSLPVKLLPDLPLNDEKIAQRTNAYTKKRQLLTTDILDLLKRRIPADAYCLLAITMEDLYPDPSWNFVFGQASLRGRVGVYSFARYDPLFFGEERAKNYRRLLLYRSAKVLVHETAHMFGLTHCIYFECIINGSNHLRESDARPLRLCPVCLRKLQWSTGFDVARRYRQLSPLYQKMGFREEARWIDQRLEAIADKSEPEKVKKE